MPVEHLSPLPSSLENIAIHTPNGKWTYRQLHEAISIVRGQLQDLAPKCIVAILIADPLWVAAAVFAVLAQDMTYFVLDQTLPEERLKKYLKICCPARILTETSCLAMAQALCPHASLLHVIQVDSKACIVANCKIAPTSMAALYFTSGSTGEPKAIFHTHGNLLKEVDIHTKTISIRSDDCFSSLYSLATIGSNRDFFAALLNGATLCPFPFKSVGMSALKEWIQQSSITVLHAIPAIYRRLMQTLSPDETLPSVRILFLAGDRVTAHDHTLFKKHFATDAQFYTGIGTSETCSLYAHFFVPRSWSETAEIPAGYAIEGCDVKVTDSAGNQVLPGRIGAISVSTPTFYSKTNTVISQNRDFYLTGDEGCFDASGLLYFCGRQGQEIKRNGERINVSEIENLLRNVAGIREAAVCMRGEHLVAFLERSTQAVSTGEIIKYLAAHLSNNAIPSYFIDIDAIPLSANGKIDRSKLPAELPIETHPQQLSQEENFIADLWRKSLPRMENITREATFKQLGGDSLAALELSRLLKKIGLQFTLEEIVDGYTLASMADKWRTKSQNEALGQVDGHFAFAGFWEEKLGAKILDEGMAAIVGQSQNNTLIWMMPAENENMLSLFRNLAESAQIIIVPVGRFSAKRSIEKEQLQQFQRIFAPYLKGEGTVALAGVCAAGKIAIHLANHLEKNGFRIGHIYIMDGYGNRLAAAGIQSSWIFRAIPRFLKSSPSDMLQKLLRFMRRPPRRLHRPYIEKPSCNFMGTFFLSEDSQKLGRLLGLGWNSGVYKNWRRIYLKGHHNTFLKSDFAHNLPTLLKTFREQP